MPKVEQGDASFRDFASKHADVASKHADDAKAAGEWAAASKYWPDVTSHNGMKVYRRDDLFDPDHVVNGGSNLQRMQRGRAPVGRDGRPVELHHLNQADEGPVVEIAAIAATFHDEHHKVIHINDHTIPSGIDRPGFDTWKRGYWKQRAKEHGE